MKNLILWLLFFACFSTPNSGKALRATLIIAIACPDYIILGADRKSIINLQNEVDNPKIHKANNYYFGIAGISNASNGQANIFDPAKIVSDELLTKQSFQIKTENIRNSLKEHFKTYIETGDRDFIDNTMNLDLCKVCVLIVGRINNETIAYSIVLKAINVETIEITELIDGFIGSECQNSRKILYIGEFSAAEQFLSNKTTGLTRSELKKLGAGFISEAIKTQAAATPKFVSKENNILLIERKNHVTWHRKGDCPIEHE